MKRFFLFVLTALLLGPSFALGCEGCKMASSNGFKEPQTVQAGVALSWSVLFMLAFVLFLLGALLWFARTACLEADKAHQCDLH